nr:adenylyltransferase/cytidyltransferase family protein [uncultured Pseudomonas sp.]
MTKRFDRIITFGTFDLFHVGHLNIISRAKKMCERLIVGVSTDHLNYGKKGRYPIYNQDDRINIVRALRDVDQVFFEDSLDLKREYIIHYSASALVMGDDWEGKFDWCNDICDVIYLPRTPNISSTEIKVSVIKTAQ